MEFTGIRLTDRQIDSLDVMVEKKIYPSVSEAIRAAVGLLEDKHGIHGKPAGSPDQSAQEAAACPTG